MKKKNWYLLLALPLIMSGILFIFTDNIAFAKEPEWSSIEACIRSFTRNDEARYQEQMKKIRSKYNRGEIVFSDTKPGPQFRRMGHCDGFISNKWWVTP